jgi:pre-mRNA-processing factor 6
MDSKRKTRRENRLKEELAKYRKKRPRIQEQFRDIKQTLSGVSEDQWDSIPEPLDYSRRNRRENRANKFDRITPMPDSILAG